jgi:hypothetical protein
MPNCRILYFYKKLYSDKPEGEDLKPVKNVGRNVNFYYNRWGFSPITSPPKSPSPKGVRGTLLWSAKTQKFTTTGGVKAWAGRWGFAGNHPVRHWRTPLLKK